MKENPVAFLGALNIPVANIRPNSRNPRRIVLNGPGGAASIAEMVRSIAADGLSEPVLVRLLEETEIAGKFYELISGERRWRAFKQMGRAEIPARLLEANEAQAAMTCLVVFLQAKGAGPMEEARGYRDALDLRDKAGRPVFTVEQVAERTGKTVDRVRRMALLCELPDFAQQALIRGDLVETVAWLIARLPDAQAREELSREALRLGLTVQGVESLIEEKWVKNLRHAPGLFDRSDAKLVAEAGSCEVCPHRTGANVERFGDCKTSAAWVCTKPACFRSKVFAARAVRTAKLVKEGLEVLSVEECDREYPSGMKSLRYDSPFVRMEDAVPADLLKREVAAHGEVTWTELLDKAKAKPAQVAGFNQAGVTEILVRREAAVAAIDAVAGDRHVFRESDRKAARPGAAQAVPVAAPAPEERGDMASKIIAAKAKVDDPELTQVRYELSSANGLLVDMETHLRTREIKLPAKIAIRLEAHLARHGLSETK